MTRRALLLAPLALRLRGAAVEDVLALVQSAAQALRGGKADAFAACFDPKMPGYRDIEASVSKLLGAASIQTSLTVSGQNGDREARMFEVDWTLEITANDSSSGTTTRRGKVICRAALQDGKWRFVRFDAPAGFFAPPHGREAWDLIARIAGALTINDVTDDGQKQQAVATFLDGFDHAMPRYEQLRTDVSALSLEYRLENSIELRQNGGDDRMRNLELDWVMTLTDWQNSARSLQRRVTAKCRVVQLGKRWRIASFEPLSLFAP
jgi:hypothetical protein